MIRGAGFKNLNLDLIFGLPSQTMDRWQESVEAVLPGAGAPVPVRTDPGGGQPPCGSAGTS